MTLRTVTTAEWIDDDHASHINFLKILWGVIFKELLLSLKKDIEVSVPRLQEKYSLRFLCDN